MEILIGCDPELFVTKNGKPRSAYNLVPGTKKEPFKCKKGAYQVDGMALEFNIDPAKTENEFVNNIREVMQQLREATPSEYAFLIKPSVRFHHSHLKVQPDEAKELGCEPDFNAYTLQENPKPNAQTTLRTASGHIHIGLEENADPSSEEHRIKYATLAKHLDLFLGVRSLEWDKDRKRRELYGNPGALRFKPYGMEYRVLSNAWLLEEKYVRFVYRQTIACINDLKKNGACSELFYSLVQQAIKRGGTYVLKHNWQLRKDKRAQAAITAMQKLTIGE